MSYNSPFSGAEVDDAVTKRHEKNKDTKLDEGGANETTAQETREHIDATDNPHGVTKTQVGLGDVDNVSAADLRDRSTHTGTQPLSTISDAGTIASQDANSVNIDGGTIDSTAVNATTLTASGDVNFDSGALFVDASTNRVGINSTSPTSTVFASGDARLGNLPNGDGTTTVVSNKGLHIGTNAGATTTVQTPLQMSAFPSSPSFTNTPPQAIAMSGWTSGTIRHNAIINRGGSALSFHTNIGGVTFSDASERMRIDSNGNVGIGVTDPSQLLDVGNSAIRRRTNVSWANHYSRSRLVAGTSSKTVLQLTIPATQAFVLIKAIWTHSRAGVAGGVGTSRGGERYFAIGRAYGGDVVLDNDFGAQGWAANSTSCGGSSDALGFFPSISRAGSESSFSPQAVNITYVPLCNNGTNGGAMFMFEILAQCQSEIGIN